MLKALKSAFLNFLHDAVSVFQYHQIIRFIANLLLSVILVRSTLTTAEISLFETTMFMVNVLTMVWMIGVTQAFTGQYGKKNEKDQKIIISISILILSLLAVLVAGFLFLFKKQFLGGFFGNGNFHYVNYIILIIIFSTPSVMVEYIYLVRNKPIHLFYYTNINFSFYLLLCVLALLFRPGVDTLLASIALWCALKFVFLFVISRIHLTGLHSGFVRQYLSYVLSLSGAAAVGVGMDYVDNFLVLHYFDIQYYAIFKYGAREFPLSLLLLSSLSNAIVPKLVYYKLQGTEIRDRTLKLMHWLFPPAIIIMFLSPYLFEWVYNSEFIDSAYIFNVYLLILISRILLPQSYNLAKNQTVVLLVSGLIELALNILLSMWWVTVWGVYGLAMATVVAYFIQKIILVIYNQKVNNIRLSMYLHVGWYVYYSVLLVLAFGMSILLK